jgi:hypothetical protein
LPPPEGFHGGDSEGGACRETPDGGAITVGLGTGEEVLFWEEEDSVFGASALAVACLFSAGLEELLNRFTSTTANTINSTKTTANPILVSRVKSGVPSGISSNSGSGKDSSSECSSEASNCGAASSDSS